MYQASQWAFINSCFIYFPQQIYQVNTYSFYQLGGTEKQRNQEMNAFNLKTREYSTRECCTTVIGNVHILSRLIEKLHLHDLEKLCYLCFTLYTFIYFFSTFTLREQIPETYCSACKKVFAESLQRFKSSVLTVSVP